MQLTFRQGIVRQPSVDAAPTAPAWLKPNSAKTGIDLIISSVPVVATFAHYDANYLIEEAKTINGAWGTDSVGSSNGPLIATGQTQYLYWDINLATGELTRGWTLQKPVVASVAPTDPEDDAHWFDSVNSRFRVYKRKSNGTGTWTDKVRVFAGVYENDARVTIYPNGTQVFVSNVNVSAGNIILGTNLRPLKQSNGTFVTTDSDLIIYQTGGQNVRFDAALSFRQADEEIPAYSLVSFRPNKRIGLASSNIIDASNTDPLSTARFVSGLSIQALAQDEVGQVVSNGIITNEQWSWTSDQINRPLFCGVTGEVTLTPPSVGALQQIGYVYDTDSIFLNIFPPVRIR